MAKVLVLGSGGMLGSTVSKYLAVEATDRSKFDAEQFLINPDGYSFIKNYDYIINCIGIIKPYCKDDDEAGVQRAIKVNALFPHLLANYLDNTEVRVIQIATDCVYTGKEGNYVEGSVQDPTDVYGKTKSLGEVNGNPKFLNIRCSIIGPEIKGFVSLLEWFLHQPDGSTLKGFSHHKWNGVTTLQYAKLCEKIINAQKFDELTKIATTHHFVPNSTATKYELLNIFKTAYKKNFTIEEVSDVGPAVDRTIATKFTILASLYPKMQMQEAIDELVVFMKG